MGGFLQSEKPGQAAFKSGSRYFSDEARLDGSYKEKWHAYCLPVEYAEQTLASEIREAAMAYFAKHQIKWHDGVDGKPSNHLCDSQVCCVNFLFPFADQPQALAKVLRRVFPDIKQMLPVEDGRYVSFEWIGAKNYLHERISRSGLRTRGANFTSADAIVMFERKDKKRQIVLIEWKYTESYSGTSLKFSKSGTDRTGIYRHLWEAADCPLDKELLPGGFDALFYNPFDQLMRQQFLAHEMEKAHELGAQVVSLLHISPAANDDFRRVTSAALESLDVTAMGVWKKLVKEQDRFVSVSSEELFGRITAQELPEMKSWVEYIHARYAWLKESDLNQADAAPPSAPASSANAVKIVKSEDDFAELE